MAWWKKLWETVSTEPAVITYGVAAAVAAEVAFGMRATPAQTAATATIAAGLATVVTALGARPVAVPVITGAVGTIATAAGAFGLHLSAAQIGAAMPVLSVILALVLRQAVTPVTTLRKGET